MTDRAPDWLRTIPLAHRGLHDVESGVAENTIVAFERAATAGVGVELDVHLSLDGVPVVVHDPDLHRVAGVDGEVGEMTSDELGQIPLAGGGIPRLADALRVLAGVPVMVELKNFEPGAGPMEPAVRGALLGHPGPVCVASFNPESLRWFRRHVPELPRVLTAGGLVDVPIPTPIRWSLDTLMLHRRARPHAVSYWVGGLDHPAVRRYRSRGGTVIAWTVTSPAELAHARACADNIIFEGEVSGDVIAAQTTASRKHRTDMS